MIINRIFIHSEIPSNLGCKTILILPNHVSSRIYIFYSFNSGHILFYDFQNLYISPYFSLLFLPSVLWHSLHCEITFLYVEPLENVCQLPRPAAFLTHVLLRCLGWELLSLCQESVLPTDDLVLLSVDLNILPSWVIELRRWRNLVHSYRLLASVNLMESV